jgi:hypothetical protein
MKKKRHAPEEFIRLLRECDSSPLSQEKILPAEADFSGDHENAMKNLTCCHAALTPQG